MTGFEVASTADLEPAVLESIRALLDRAFHGEFSNHDWTNSLGGRHVVAVERGVVVGHASVVRRSLEIEGRRFATGYVEAVATEPSRQGTGVGTAVIQRVGRVIRGEYELGALSSGLRSFYEPRGWELWRGPSSVRRAGRVVPTPEDDGGVMVLRFGPSVGLDLWSAITCDDRPGDVW